MRFWFLWPTRSIDPCRCCQVCLTYTYALRLQDRLEPFWIVSMMMSAGAIYSKCGAMIYYPLLRDQKKNLEGQIASKAANWLNAEEIEALRFHGIHIRSKAKASTKGDLRFYSHCIICRVHLFYLQGRTMCNLQCSARCAMLLHASAMVRTPRGLLRRGGGLLGQPTLC